MRGANDELRDAREANGEISTTLSLIEDRHTQAHAALATRDIAKATELLRKVSAYVDEIRGYLNAAHDAHHALGRCLKKDTA